MLFANEQSQFILKDYQNTTPGFDYNWKDDMWTKIPCIKVKKYKKKPSPKDTEISHVIDHCDSMSDYDTSDSDSTDSYSKDDSKEESKGAWGGAGLEPPKKL